MLYDEDERNGDFKLIGFFFVKIIKNMFIIIRVIMVINYIVFCWLDFKFV